MFRNNMLTAKKILDYVFHYGIFAWIAAVFVWYFIIITLHDGISCDEGYYLMGFLRGQNIEGQGSDFHAIVRALCRPFPDDDIMVYRYMRLALNAIALIIFAATSYLWLSQKHGFSASRWAYYPIVALAGAMSFTFAAPTLSYDNLEVIITLLSTSCLFILISHEKRWIQLFSAFGVGFFQWFAFTNYPPAGLCLTLLIIAFYLIERKNFEASNWHHSPLSFHLSLFIIGLIVAITLSHFFIHDLRIWGTDFGKMFVSTFTETSTSRHDSGSLVSGMLMTVGKQVLIMVPIAALSTLFYNKVRMREWLLWLLTLGLCLFLLIYRKAYELRGTLMLIPVAIIFGKVLAHLISPKNISHFTFYISPNKYHLSLFIFHFSLLIVLVAIPFAGVFGTNQVIMRKAIIFTPYWLLAYNLLTTHINEKAAIRCNLIFMTLLFAGYFYLGNFQRYQYYYTPRSSKHELIGASRPQHIKVSKYQQEYYADLLDSLRVAGCQPGDRFIAFEEDQMAVYLAGGYIEGRLPYHWWQYKQMDGEPPKAFVLFLGEEGNVLEHFKSAGWNFPAAYRRMEMRQASENMGDNLRTVIYVKKS